MSLKSESLRTVCLLVALGVASTAQAQQYYSISGGGGQAQIGDGLPLPAQDQITIMGGKNSTGGPIGTYTNFPDQLLVPVNPDKGKAFLIKQTAVGAVGTVPAHTRMKVPPGVFRRIPTTNGKETGVPVPKKIAVAANNPNVLQVRTTLSFSGPAKTLGTMTFKAGQRVKNNTTYAGTPVGAVVVYKSKTGKRFGGPSQTRIKNLGKIGLWVDLPNVTPLPCIHPDFGGVRADCVAKKLPAYPKPLAAAGGPKGNKVTTKGTPEPFPRSVNVSVGAKGTILQETPVAVPGNALNNAATSIGFPWTSGAITISQPAALGMAELFHITGMDGRVGGVGTIQLVASALSKRKTTGPNANRSWATYTLPEPGAVLGAGAALAVLGVCHALVRRRR